jgi:hypothetical protein
MLGSASSSETELTALRRRHEAVCRASLRHAAAGSRRPRLWPFARRWIWSRIAPVWPGGGAASRR